jgi:hypothetical protein
MMIASKQDPAVTVRFPKYILDAATRAAMASGRSRNSEIVIRLAQSLKVKKGK